MKTDKNPVEQNSKTSSLLEGCHLNPIGVQSPKGNVMGKPELESSRKLDRYGTEIIGQSSALRAVLKQVRIVGPTNATVMIQGETGTGKELIARAIHHRSSCRGGPLVKTNCAAIPSGLLESELFGHERGAFTGAIAQKIGRFELAHQGTLFLDEVGDIPPELQPKLLRVLQEMEIERVGGTQVHQIEVRMIAASSRDLPQMIADRQFRSDLYYRLNVFPIRVPSLHERSEDIPLLVEYFVNRYAAQMNKHIEIVPQGAMDFLLSYHWPGNIRELQNFIERAVIMSPGKVLHVPLAEIKTSHPRMNTTSAENLSNKPPTLEECERAHILKVLDQTHWIVGGPNGAARILNVKRTTLIGKMQKMGITRKAELAAPSDLVQ
ncbi:MAG: Formate hydrogenlyase transcriptional activator [Verrucomicrobiales bacterium]|nr:Formate hydrogenlyase transcriptional activator [Verrucomicrobiales bacterium]